MTYRVQTWLFVAVVALALLGPWLVEMVAGR